MHASLVAFIFTSMLFPITYIHVAWVFTFNITDTDAAASHIVNSNSEL